MSCFYDWLMKNFLISFFLTWYAFMYSQISLKVNYETVIQTKINWNGFNVPESQKQEIERQSSMENKKPRKFVLYYDDGNSFFQNDPSEKLPLTRQKTEYYRLKNEDGIFRLNDYIVEEFYGYYPMDNVNIEFKDETQIIENYNCKLALCKIENTIYKLWYTEEIPISAGPYNYYKVPGLILKIESPNLLCYAVNVSKEIDGKDIKKMNPELKIYEGEELKRKIAEGREKMLSNSRQRADEMLKSLQKN